MRPAARALAGVLALVAAGACAPSIPPAALPRAPIALLFRTPEEGRRRAEVLAASRAREPARSSGVARLEDLEALFGGDATRVGDLRDLAGRLALLDARTGELTPVAATPPGATPLSWSNDGERLLFTHARHAPAQLYELVVATGHVRALTRGPALHPSGCYLGDARLVVTRMRRSERGIEARLLLREAGGRARALTPGPFDRNPSCAPGGDAIVYMAAGARGEEVLMGVAPDGGAPRRLGPGRDPAFTHDGEWVVYSARAGDRFELRRMRPDGSGKTRIGRGVADELWPSASPGRRYVVFEVEELGRARLFVRSFDGREQRLLLETGDGAHPIWAPLETRRRE